MSSSNVQDLQAFCQENKLSHIESQLTAVNITLSDLLSKDETSLNQLSSQLQLGTLFRRRLIKAVLKQSGNSPSVGKTPSAESNQNGENNKNDNSSHNDSLQTLGFDIPAMNPSSSNPNANSDPFMNISPMHSPKAANSPSSQLDLNDSNNSKNSKNSKNDENNASTRETASSASGQQSVVTEKKQEQKDEENENKNSNKNKKIEAATREETEAMHVLFNEFNECCNSIDTIRESFDILDKSYNKCKNSINSTFDELIAMLYQKQETLLKNSGEMVDKKKRQLKQQYEALSYHKNMINEGRNQCSKYIHDPNLKFNTFHRQQSILTVTNAIMDQNVSLFLGTNPNISLKYNKQLFKNVLNNHNDGEEDSGAPKKNDINSCLGAMDGCNQARVCDLRTINVTAHSISVQWNVAKCDESELLESGIETLQQVDGINQKKKSKFNQWKGYRGDSINLRNLSYQVAFKTLRIENLILKTENKIDDDGDSDSDTASKNGESGSDSSDNDDSDNDEKSEVKGRRSIVDASDIEWHFSPILGSNIRSDSCIHTIKKLDHNQAYLIKVRCYDVTLQEEFQKEKEKQKQNENENKNKRIPSNSNNENEKCWTVWSKPIAVTTGAIKLEWSRKRCAMTEEEWYFNKQFNIGQHNKVSSDFKTSVVKVKHKNEVVSFKREKFGKIGINFNVTSHKHLKFGWKYTVLSYGNNSKSDLKNVTKKQASKERIFLGFMDNTQSKKLNSTQWNSFGYNENLMGCTNHNKNSGQYRKQWYWQVPMNGETRQISGSSVYVNDPLSYYVEIGPSRDYILVCAPLGKESCLNKSLEAKERQNESESENDSDGDSENENKHRKKKQRNRSEIRLEFKNGKRLQYDSISFVVNMHKRECYMYLNDKMLDVFFKNIPTSIVPVMSNCVKGNAASVSLSGIYV